MSVHLVGGGWSETGSDSVFAPFVIEAAARAESVGYAGRPRIAVIVVRDGDGLDHAAKLVAEASIDTEIDDRKTVLVENYPADPAILDDVDGILVGGGLTPAYHASLSPLFDRLRELVGAGVPYLGFSAGAMIAAERAIVGGWRIGGVAVAPEETGEELDDVAVLPGIGLVDLSIDVHAAQWGTLGRLVAAAAAGISDGGVAIDEGTALIVGGETGARVIGSGNVWRVLPTGDGSATVSAIAAVEVD
ncbi:MAG: Type 1 glutamine amidotransferase-like domain-containing protein [Naasia sp.]